MVLRTAVIAIVCGVIAAVIFSLRSTYGLYLAAAIPAIIAAGNLVFNIRVFRIMDLPMASFSKKYMINRLLKFIVNLAIFLTIIFAVKQNKLDLIVVYISAYLIFFVQEIFELQTLTKLRKHQNA